jgi:TolB-like protein/DNA-binding winged helix-turn-helix (wHTH) protein
VAVTLLQFGEFELDRQRFELRRNGRPLRLERKPMELLILLAASDGRLISRAEIAEHLWDREVFVDTEHGINTAIRKIRHTLREDPDNPRFLQTVTGKGYRFVGVAVTNPSSPSPASDPDTRPSPSTNPGAPSLPALLSPAKVGSHLRHWLIASAAAVVLIVIGFATFGARIVRGHTAHPAITSLAVLPLDNLTGNPSQNYLADGMTDELTTQLARDSTLRVISRTSVMQYKGAHSPLPEIARALNVDGIIEGSLSRSGNLVHVTVQLIQAPTDTHLWAESYDRDPNDLVSLPQDAALTIAKETHSSIASAAPIKYINPAAHDAYLRGHYLWFSKQSDSGAFFLKAVQLQPDYALAWAGLANYYGGEMIGGDLDPRTTLALEKDAALKSVHLDDSLAEAHVALAASRWIVDWDFNGALNELDRAIQLDPKLTEAHHLRGKILSQLNHHDEALAEQRIAMEINPFERPWSLALYLIWARRFDAAIADAQQRLVAHPDPALWWMLSQAYAGKHMDAESEHALEQTLILSGDPGNQAAAERFHRAFAQGGKRAVLLLRLDHLKAKSKKVYVGPVEFAGFYAQLGDRQQALSSLDEALSQHSPGLFDIQNDAAFDSLHSDPHYRAIVHQIGLPPAY